MVTKNHSIVIVMPRSEPDLDGVACAVGYAEYLRLKDFPAHAWYPGIPDGEARYAIDQFPSLSFASEDDVSSARSFVLVDSSDLDGIPPFIEPAWFVEIIDHRMYTDANETFRNAHVQIDPVGAAATLIVERFMQIGKVPSHTSSIMLYGAIHSNTLCLRGAITDERDKMAAQWLKAKGNIPDDWLEHQFSARRRELLEDFEQSIHRERKIYNHKDGSYAVAQLEYGGATKTVKLELDRLLSILRDMKPTTMLNMVDIEEGSSHVICPDPVLRELVEHALAAKFRNSVAYLTPALLRKQIVAAVSNTHQA